jgi:hypothetical protein
MEAAHEPPHPPTFNRCDCVRHLDVLENVERGLRGLSKIGSIPSSPLLGMETKDLWITAGQEFLAHLRHLAIRMPATWMFKVVSDAEITTSWLGSVGLQGKDVLDADAYAVSTRFVSVPDIMVPPDLVIIRMGIKKARLAPAAEVLAEALNIRLHEGKPTWLWDEPFTPLDAGHMFWSDVVGRILRPWPRLNDLQSGKTQSKGSTKARPQTKKPRGRKSLRGSRDE